MARCDYSFYDGGDRCRLMSKLKNQSSDRVNSDHYRNICSYSEGYKRCPFYEAYQEESKSTSGCYLTSACTKARGLPDNCEELTILRKFRDEWLKNQMEGEKDIKEYYAFTPFIVEEIDKKTNAGLIYEKIYKELVVTCVNLIKENKNDEAYKFYKNYTRKLKNEILL